MGLISPIQGPYTETQGFAGNTGGHPGVDLAAPIGTPVVAPLGGTITIAGYDAGGFGNWVVEKLSNGWTAVFGHLSAESVTAGQSVQQGQLLGAVGSTGDSTGPHLHYQLEQGGPPPVPLGSLIDPQPYLAQTGSAYATLTSATAPTGGPSGAGSATPSSSASQWPSGDFHPFGGGLLGGVTVPKSGVFRVVLMVTGLLLLLIAFHALAEGNKGAGPITVLGNAGSSVRRSATQAPPPAHWTSPGPPPNNDVTRDKWHDVRQPKGGDAERTAATVKTVRANPAPAFDEGPPPKRHRVRSYVAKGTEVAAAG